MMAALLRRRAATVVTARGFRAGKVQSSQAPIGGIMNSWGKEFDLKTFIFKSDQSSHGLRLYHKLNFGLIALGPLALVLSPSSMNIPIDILLSVMIPLHGHVGGNDVISDYAKKITKAKWFDQVCRRGLLGVTIVTFLGLTKLNMDGVGVTESFKSLWRPRSVEHKH